MTLRFQADEDLRGTIIRGVKNRQPEIEFVSAGEAETIGFSDDELLAFAAQSGRILVSHDLRTMLSHFNRFIENYLSPGLLLVHQKWPVSEVIDYLVLLWTASEAEEWVNRYRFMPEL